MGSLSVSHWIVVVALLLLLFGGRGKISALMGDFAKGIRSLKMGMQGDDMVGADTGHNSPRSITRQARGANALPAETETRSEGAPF